VSDNQPYDAFWILYRPNRAFNKYPRMVVMVQGTAYRTSDGKEVLHGTSGLCCVGAWNRNPRISVAIKKQIDPLGCALNFQVGRPSAFELAVKVASLAPPGLDRMFFSNSGSEACDTAVKVEPACGERQYQLLVGREHAFYGVGFGGISAAGIPANRRVFGNAMLRSHHLRATWNTSTQAFTKSQIKTGAEMADKLGQRIVSLHDAANIAVVTGFGRLGQMFAAHVSERMHGYTCPGHTYSCTAGLAVLEALEAESLIGRARELRQVFEKAVHSPASAKDVASIRNIGLAAGIELAPRRGVLGQRGADAQGAAFANALLILAPDDSLTLAPPVYHYSPRKSSRWSNACTRPLSQPIKLF
jgi:beta-alanine--pyruvate transaminase